MTDIAQPFPFSGPRRLDVTSEEAKRRIKARYRAEARFKAYGLIALLTTTLFVFALIGNIVWKGLPAFVEHRLLMDVAVPAGPFGAKPDAQSIRSADYFPITREALKSAIPGVEGRRSERTLTGLLSSGAADDLRGKLLANPALIGTTVRTTLLLSDDADMYFKGRGTEITQRSPTGTARVTGTRGQVNIVSTSDDFAAELAAAKQSYLAKSAVFKAESARITRQAGGKENAQAKELLGDAERYAGFAAGSRARVPLDSRLSSVLVAINGGIVKLTELSAREVSGEVLLPLTSEASASGGTWRIVTYVTPEADRKVSDLEVAFLERFRELGKLEAGFNWRFFTSGDSREPELAGIRGAIIGTVLTLTVTLILCLPIGVMAAIYLEEFAPKNWFTDLLEVNINNLAAVPSIVFGLLGLAIFLNFFDMPRSAPLVGGLVLALLVLPTIIIASRAALKAVPPSIKEAALGVGASHQQAIFHHVLPLALPGIMTGTIIGMAHALGETAPLLMIGMVAFIVDVPQSFTQSATVLPVQIFLWSDLPEAAFQTRTAGAILVLLGVLFAMNGAAIWLRKRFERRW
jgi:phosphate transport system permease protein